MLAGRIGEQTLRNEAGKTGEHAVSVEAGKTGEQEEGWLQKEL